MTQIKKSADRSVRSSNLTLLTGIGVWFNLCVFISLVYVLPLANTKQLLALTWICLFGLTKIVERWTFIKS